MMSELGKTLVVIGVGIFLLGGLLWLSGGTLKNFPVGRLPGDILIQTGHFTFYFPLTTCILLSIGLSALLWLGRVITR
jgi:hypothetical protein